MSADINDLIRNQMEIYNEALLSVKAEDFLPNPRDLARQFFLEGKWAELPKADTVSLTDRNKPLSRSEKTRLYEETYLDSVYDTPEPGGFYRFVDGVVEVVPVSDAYLCVAVQLNGLLKKNVGSEGVSSPKFLI